MNSFILTSEGGHVLVVDGGFDADAEHLLTRLQEITEQTVPHVDAWLLTHPHTDHIDAFCKLMEDGACITLGTVLCNFPSPAYCALEDVEWGNHVPSVERFEALHAPLEKICRVQTGDRYIFGEIQIDILYVPLPHYRTNHINNASVISRVTLAGKQILFLGDAGAEEGQECLAQLPEPAVLRADYVQMSHHGQNGVEQDFYLAVKPTACLWCTPQWLWDNDAGKGYNTHTWKTLTVRAWMDDMGVKEHYVMKDGEQKILL